MQNGRITILRVQIKATTNTKTKAKKKEGKQGSSLVGEENSTPATSGLT